MDSVIERLRAEKAEHAQSYFDDGVKAGEEDAKRMSYGELVSLHNQFENACPDASDTPRVDPDIFDSYLDMQIQDLRAEDASFDPDAFTAGWINGVFEFFDSVKDDL